MKMLVTGATGFIGSHLAERLLGLGHEVRGLVRTPENRAELSRLGVELVRGDVTDPATLSQIARGIDIVFHVAAFVSDWGPWSAFQSATVDGTANMLRAAVDANVSRFLHISSAVVYDDQTARRLRIITEEAPHQNDGDHTLDVESVDRVFDRIGLHHRIFLSLRSLGSALG